MKGGSAYGITVIAAGCLYVLAPVFFPVCEASGGKAMKCFWTARAEIGVGAMVVAGGLLYLFSADFQRRLGLVMMIGLSALLGAAIPTALIGVCANEAMLCRAGTLPAWLIVSGLLLLISILKARGLAARLRPEGDNE